jgi:hypothetical protein
MQQKLSKNNADSEAFERWIQNWFEGKKPASNLNTRQKTADDNLFEIWIKIHFNDGDDSKDTQDILNKLKDLINSKKSTTSKSSPPERRDELTTLKPTKSTTKKPDKDKSESAEELITDKPENDKKRTRKPKKSTTAKVNELTTEKPNEDKPEKPKKATTEKPVEESNPDKEYLKRLKDSINSKIDEFAKILDAGDEDTLELISNLLDYQISDTDVDEKQTTRSNKNRRTTSKLITENGKKTTISIKQQPTSKLVIEDTKKTTISIKNQQPTSKPVIEDTKTTRSTSKPVIEDTKTSISTKNQQITTKPWKNAPVNKEECFDELPEA